MCAEMPKQVRTRTQEHALRVHLNTPTCTHDPAHTSHGHGAVMCTAAHTFVHPLTRTAA